jgi:methylated-DNA-[protein]-cysteine S-methyltransferase
MNAALITSPIGPIYVELEDGALTRLYTAEHARFASADAPDPAFDDVRNQLDEYFAGTRTAFDLSLRPKGTAFEQRVWAHLQTIPYGETTTYGEIARELGSVARAVGRANGANPISIVVPCHRVVGTNGSLTGYAGGLGTKRELLDHERGVASFDHGVPHTR